MDKIPKKEMLLSVATPPPPQPTRVPEELENQIRYIERWRKKLREEGDTREEAKRLVIK